MRGLALKLLALAPIPLITAALVWHGLGTKPPRGVRLPKAHRKPGAKALLALPKALAGWKHGKLEHFDKKTLFDRIDGAAPPYIKAGFQGLVATELQQPGGGKETLTVDVYALGTAPQAKALYERERGPLTPAGIDAGVAGRHAVAVGDFAHQSSGSLAFVVGLYYVKLAAFEPAGQRALVAIARELAATLKKKGGKR